MISMVMSVIGQDPNLTVEEASELAAGAKRAALAMFPDKELAYDLLYKPRLQRLMKETVPPAVSRRYHQDFRIFIAFTRLSASQNSRHEAVVRMHSSVLDAGFFLTKSSASALQVLT